MAERFIYSPETIIKAYSIGVFPMAEAHDSEDIYFYEPDMRGIIPVCPPHCLLYTSPSPRDPL